MIKLFFLIKNYLKVVLENDNETNPPLSTAEESEHKAQGDPNEVFKNETNEVDILDLSEVFYTFFWAPKKVNKSKNY